MACILIVDDEISFINVIEQLLVSQGHQVICAANGKEALKIIDSQVIDIVITEIIMPEMDGFELILKLCKRPNSPKIIAMSGGSFQQEGGELLSTAKLMGANSILKKPFNPLSLNNAITLVLGT